MAAPMLSNSSSHYDFMYPDLLSKDGLLYILRQRYISHLHNDLDSMDKEALVELYNRYILPLPQRAYTQNKRGQQMTKAQKSMDRKRKAHSSDNGDSGSEEKKARLQGTSSGLVNHHSIPSPSGDRLKPPPSCINFERKRIKLKSDVTRSAEKKSEDVTKSTSAREGGTLSNVKESIDSGEQTALCQESPSPKKKKFVPISWP